MQITFSNKCISDNYSFLQNHEQSLKNQVKQYEIVSVPSSQDTYYKAFGAFTVENGQTSVIVSTLKQLNSRILELVCPVIANRPDLEEFGLVKVPHPTDSAKDVYCDFEATGDIGTLEKCQTLDQLATSSTEISPIPPFSHTKTVQVSPSVAPTVTPTVSPSVAPTVTPTVSPSVEPTDSTNVPPAFSNSYVLLGTGIALVACISYIAYKSMMKRTTSDSTKKSTSVLPTTQNLNPPKVSKISPNRIEPNKTFSSKRTSFLKV